MTQVLCRVCNLPLELLAAHFACAARPHVASVPERIGPYPILRAIGSGGMGTVCAGLQHCPRREVAIKVIRDGVFADETLRAKFLREREIAGAFEHPNIIRVYDAGEDQDGQLYYVMELAQRGTLRDFLQTEALSVRDAVRLMIEVSFAVDYAHQRKVLHRDLKPDNILIGEDRRARVTDFGVARLLAAGPSALDEPECDATFVGSYPYMAPEQSGYRGAGQTADIGPPADVYSLGAIMYELVRGAPPYAARTRQQLWAAYASGPPADLFGFRVGADYDLEAVIMKALSHDPAQRYPRAAAFAEDLRRTLGRRAPLARSRNLRGRLLSALAHHVGWLGILLAALSISAFAITSFERAANRARAQERVRLEQGVKRAARDIGLVFDTARQLTRRLSSDPDNLEMLAQRPPPNAQDDARLVRSVQGSALISSAFLLAMDGRPVAHAPPEPPGYYQQSLQHRIYFGGARLSGQAWQDADVFVSPLFLSRSSDRLIKVAFSAACYDQDGRQLGVAVATVAVDKLLRTLDHAGMSLVTLREVEESALQSTNVETVRISLDARGQPQLEPPGAAARQQLTESVAGTFYQVSAELKDPASEPRDALMLGIAGLVGLCGLALFLSRAARADHAA